MILEKYTTITFPELGLQFDPKRYIEIGPLTIYLYGMIIAAGLMLAIIYGLQRSKQFGLKQDDILDGVLWIVPTAIICARAYYCIFSWSEYASDPISVFYIWKGGLAIYGAVIGAAVCTVIHCRIKKMSLLATLDLVALAFLIGQAIGRWGNFFNREAFGSVTDSFLRMGLFNTRIGEFEYHHPTFLYESLWNAAGFVLLHFLTKKRQYDGQIALGYVAWYGLGRAFIEGLRTDSLYLGPFRVSQLLAGVSFLTAAGILIYMALRPHDRDMLFVNRVRNAEQLMEVLDGIEEEAQEDEETKEENEVDNHE